jgi:hypothetical protein
MIARQASVSLVLALALAGCDPLHTIGSENPDGGTDGGSDGGTIASCAADAGCRCGTACSYADDLHGPGCIRQTSACSLDGGSSGCADGGLCLLPVVNGSVCPVPRCFDAVGATSCVSDADCLSCGESCAQVAGAGVCSPIATCMSNADCAPGGACSELYRNGVPCGIRQCLDE